ncbi:MAG: segregation/condensation protein A [Chloroflexi bacterium]|nr:segregation/condensation protein A [Chloroflexota bacterium]
MPDPLKLRPADDYIVQLDVFEGPMDLLLHLIEKEELPITSVSLAQITGQYLDYLARMEELKPDGIAEFLVMAARLLHIKSLALLPQPESESDEEEEDPGERLARQLREYKRFKEAAAFLRELEAEGKRGYVRLAPPPKLEKRLDLTGIDVNALLHAVREVLQDLDAPPLPAASIEPHRITVQEKMESLRATLARRGVVRFRQFLRRARSRVEVIVSFMAVLELIKQNEVRVRQPDLFGEIWIERQEASEEPQPQVN